MFNQALKSFVNQVFKYLINQYHPHGFGGSKLIWHMSHLFANEIENRIGLWELSYMFFSDALANLVAKTRRRNVLPSHRNCLTTLYWLAGRCSLKMEVFVQIFVNVYAAEFTVGSYIFVVIYVFKHEQYQGRGLMPPNWRNFTNHHRMPLRQIY